VRFFDPHAPCKSRARTDLDEKLGFRDPRSLDPSDVEVLGELGYIR
jgi:hypothetical protein